MIFLLNESSTVCKIFYNHLKSAMTCLGGTRGTVCLWHIHNYDVKHLCVVFSLKQKKLEKLRLACDTFLTNGT